MSEGSSPANTTKQAPCNHSVSYGSLDRLRELRRSVGRSRSYQNASLTFDASSIERSAAALQAKNEYLRTLGPVPKSSAARPASACSAHSTSATSGKQSPAPRGSEAESSTEPLHKVVRTLWDAAHAKQASEWGAQEPSTRLPIAIASLGVFASVASSIAPLVPKMSDFFNGIAKAVGEASAEAAALQASLTACTEELRRVHAAVDKKISELRAQADSKVRTAINGVLNRDDELAALAALNASMGNRLRDLEAENSALHEQLAATQAKEEDYRNDVTVKRTQVQIFQAKMNTVLQENMYLREIAKHNRDLLLEIDSLKDQLAAATAAKAAEVDAAVAAKSQAYFEVQAAKTASKKLVAALRAAEEDVNQLRRQHDMDESLHSKCKADRDEMVASRTPRPQKTELLSALQQAWRVLGEEGVSNRDEPERLPTKTLLEAMAAALSKLAAVAKQLKTKAETDQRLLEYVSGDDFEVVARALQSTSSGSLGEGVVLRRGGADGPLPCWTMRTVVPFPLHSRVQVLEGPWTSLGHVRGQHRLLGLEFGRVGCRTMALEELLLLIDKLLADRRGNEGCGNLHVPWSATVRTSLQRAYNLSPPQLVEALCSLEYSLDLFCFIPQVELFRKIVQREAPEELYVEIISQIDGLCRAFTESKDVRSVPLSKSSSMRLAKRSLFINVLQRMLPQLPDTDIFRLLAVAASEAINRMSAADSKAVQAAIGGKDEVPLDVLFVAPDGRNGEGFQETVAVGQPATRSVLATFRRPGSSLLSPFLAAMFRQLAQQYEMMSQQIAMDLAHAASGQPPNGPAQDMSSLSQHKGAIVTKARVASVLSAAGAQPQAVDALAESAVAQGNLVSLTRSDQPTVANVSVVLRNLYIRSLSKHQQFAEITSPMEPAKLVDATKKNILGLRGVL